MKKHYNEKELALLDSSIHSAAPLDLRVNTIKSDVKSIFKTLQQQGLEPNLMPYSPYGIRLLSKPSLAKNELFLSGKIEVQDESSQIAGMLLNPKRGDFVVDFCAGAGGKALLFGMIMRNTGRIYAFDTNETRLNALNPRLLKSGLSNIYPQIIANENDIKIKRLHGKIDKVFVDAPCSGLGTLRRNPDLQLRQNPQKIAQLNEKQLSILSSA